MNPDGFVQSYGEDTPMLFWYRDSAICKTKVNITPTTNDTIR